MTTPTRHRTRLTCLAVAGPLWTVVSLAQAATREGFDLTRHPLSALSTGTLGWLQIANFVVAGVLTVIGASGLRQSLTSRWAPRLVLAAGVGQIAAGILPMDPVTTPAPATMSWHGIGHMIAGSVTFISLIAACYVLGRHFTRANQRQDATLSHVAGTALLLGYGWAVTGGPAASLTIAVGAITALLWISAVAIRLR
jgi:hypothetical membrane protein